MVFTMCETSYDGKNHSYFDMFSFEPDHFQKYAIEGLYNDKHVLVTAHTGSGKTLPAEFAIRHFTAMGKKVIYTAPIKSLSNQKYHELSNEFPDISFGILTGDIKFNPEADCVIMTTEILRNLIFYADKEYSPLDFNIQLDHIQCVIFDEVHYINDDARGHVWEECIMTLPQHIQMLMLSATINKPERFASWISDIKEKDILIAGTNHRVVPLVHYTTINIPESTANIIDKSFQIDSFNNTFIPIKTRNQTYTEKPIHLVNKIYKHLKKNSVLIKPRYVLNTVVNKLKHEQKLPAICFVFSRKKAEEYANMIQSNLHDTEYVDDDTKKTTIVRRECESILRQLSNHKEYSNTPEYSHTLSLLEKGIAVHHSGILPILREMIELLFSKGYIKLLFATETFAVGINMPTKTVLFTSLTKFDGIQERILYPHEYTQMAGRAGRRGLDSIGHVIHLHSMFEPLSHSEYKHMLSGNPPTITSKLHVNMHMVLRMAANGCDFTNIDVNQVLPYLKNSLVYRDITLQIKQIQSDIFNLEHVLKSKAKHNLFTDQIIFDKIQEYVKLTDDKMYTKRAKHKQINSKLKEIENNISTYGNIQDYVEKYHDYEDKQNELISKQSEEQNTKQYIQQECLQFYSILCKNMFLRNGKVTPKGLLGSYIMEANPIIISDLYAMNCFHDLSVIEIAQLLSCFTDIRLQEKYKLYHYLGENQNLKNVLGKLESISSTYYDIESRNIGYIKDDDYYYHYDLIDYIDSWCKIDSEDSAKFILQDIQQYKIFSGEFVKAVLKIQAIALELENACRQLQDNELVAKLHALPELLSKSIVTNQSLYI